jgi:hypothetical protein
MDSEVKSVSVCDKFEMGLIIAILLVIAGVEMNPGPFSMQELEQIVETMKPAIKAANEVQTKEIQNQILSVTTLESKYKEQCSTQYNEMKSEVQQLKQSNRELQDMFQFQGALLRKNNILIHGIQENENENTAAVVHDICTDLHVDLNDESITEAFRIGRKKGQRPILCKLNSFSKKKEILDKKISLGSNQFSIYHDLSKVDRDNKKLLKPNRDEAIQRNQRHILEVRRSL